MPLFFWLPMIILGGMVDVAADAAAGRSGQHGPDAGSRPCRALRIAQRPMPVKASLQANARMPKAETTRQRGRAA
jgi:hypothetical protein